MKILKSTRTAFERQILESVLIQKSRDNYLMNNKAEYNRCALPRCQTYSKARREGHGRMKKKRQRGDAERSNY